MGSISRMRPPLGTVTMTCPMLSYAIGIAMGNGTAKARAAADYVTGDVAGTD